MSISFIKTIFLSVTIGAILFLQSHATASQDIQEGKMYVWVKKNYSSWENPLHSEFIVNGKTVNIFSSDTIEPVEEYLKPGLNAITIKTIPMEPAKDENDLIFRIGPMHRDPKDATRFIMSPVIWKFRNGTDWHFKNGYFQHPLGPDLKEVELTYHLYWAGLDHEKNDIKANDYVLQIKPNYSTWNSPVILTLSVNGTPLSSFLGVKRQVIITSLLKPGKNEVKLISHRVMNSFEENDMKGSISGPAVWYPGENKYMLKPVTTFSAMAGWKKDKKSGQLINQATPDDEYIERTMLFMIKDLQEKSSKKSKPQATPSSLKDRNKI